MMGRMPVLAGDDLSHSAAKLFRCQVKGLHHIAALGHCQSPGRPGLPVLSGIGRAKIILHIYDNQGGFPNVDSHGYSFNL
jgi:hypothetical protein